MGTTRFAAVGNDGMRPVVWGLGATEDEALADAREQDGAGDDLTVHPITAEQAARIEAGDVSWPPAVTDAQIEALRAAAAAAGDIAMEATCRRALAGDEECRAVCAEIIEEARARAAEEG